MDRAQRDLQHVGLPTAAAIVHIELRGVPPDATKSAEMRDTLNEIAHAMCVVIPVYARNCTSGLPVEIPLSDLVTGRFIRGAHRLVTETGAEYEGLTVQRRDILTAIRLLKRIGFGTKAN